MAKPQKRKRNLGIVKNQLFSLKNANSNIIDNTDEVQESSRILNYTVISIKKRTSVRKKRWWLSHLSSTVY